MRTLAAVVVLAMMAALQPATAAAQWHIGLEVTATRFGGTARDSANDAHTTLNPGASTMLGVRVDREGARWGVGFKVGYGKTGVRAAAGPISLTDKSVGDLIELDVLMQLQVGGIGPSGAVKVELGPALPLWDNGEGFRLRFAALGAAAYEWQIAGRLTGALRLEALLSPSWFDPGELPPELERVMTRRAGLSLGLRYRLSRLTRNSRM
jgi:hypothetical protein